MVRSEDWGWINEMLKEFGHDHFNTLGLNCKISAWGCMDCEFLHMCNIRPPEHKLRLQYDIVGDNLERVSHRFKWHKGIRDIPKARMPYWLREKLEISIEAKET
jgi:hypothetical protein